MIQHGVSIVICCHNGAARLPETVRHIALQEVPKHIPWEFVLVDNASTDDSAAIALDTWLQFSSAAEFRIVHEPTIGLSHARAKGFKEAQYEFVVMCDDDNWLAKNYVALTYRIMAEKPQVAALGGYGKLLYEIEPPEWVEQSHMFAAGRQAPASGKVYSNRLYGAGCVIRKSAYFKLKELGFKSFLTDRKGTQLSSGGDHELCYALTIMGYDVWFDERLQFFHYITRERLTWEYFMRYANESAICFDVLTSYKMIASDASAYKFSFVVIARDFYYCFRRFLRINFNRLLVARSSATGKVLYFRHIIVKYKLIAYLQKFRAIMQNHEEILKFKEACVMAKMIEKREPQYSGFLSLRPLRLLLKQF